MRARAAASAWGGTLASTALLAACGEAPSILDPKGPAASRVAGVWWLLFALSSIVVVAVGLLIGVAIARRRRPPPDGPEPRWTMRTVVIGGVILPLLVLTFVWFVTLRDLEALTEPPGDPELTVEVTGHRWWWEVRYPEEGVVTANEMHIPVGVPVRVELTTADVIHSFWIPELSPKTDQIPGQVNRMWLQADEPGIYRGQCAEFCGLQHANMAFFVIAEERDAFDAWVRSKAQPAEEPASDVLARGREVFRTAACAACHTIRGVSQAVPPGTTVPGPEEPITAVRGPDLTHFGSRLTIGAGAAPNRTGFLGGWIVDSQSIKPGNLMPPVQLEAEDLDALIAYLESLE